ncbi:MAG: hypothetical protein LIO79_01525 [Rikenellaceae bacterium]|nr:hypothetical protein [Rikenellaceae bacterium]
MKIINPTEFSPALQSVYYTAIPEQGDEGPYFFEISDGSGTVAGAKTFDKDDTFLINVSAYLKSGIDVAPAPTQQSTIICLPDRTLNSNIIYNGASYSTVHLMGNFFTSDDGLMSEQLTARSIYYGDQDEITFLSDAGEITAEIIIQGTGKKFFLQSLQITDKSPVTVIINCDDLKEFIEPYRYRYGEKFPSFTLSIKNEEEQLFRITYHILRFPGIRVCWWNRYGAVDFFTFPILTEKRTVKKGNKTGLNFTAGFSSLTEEVNNLAAGILSSPQIWLTSGDEFIPVSVVSDSIITDTYHSPQYVSFSTI